jgi:hypothetical protein
MRQMNATLEHVNLRCNDICDRGAVHLARCISGPRDAHAHDAPARYSAVPAYRAGAVRTRHFVAVVSMCVSAAGYEWWMSV